MLMIEKTNYLKASHKSDSLLKVYGAVRRILFSVTDKIFKSDKAFDSVAIIHEDPHTTFFCTPHDAAVVKDARF